MHIERQKGALMNSLRHIGPATRHGCLFRVRPNGLRVTKASFFLSRKGTAAPGLPGPEWIFASSQFSPWWSSSNKHIHCALPFTSNFISISLVNPHKTSWEEGIHDQRWENRGPEEGRKSVYQNYITSHLKKLRALNPGQLFKSLVTAFSARQAVRGYLYNRETALASGETWEKRRRYIKELSYILS